MRRTIPKTPDFDAYIIEHKLTHHAITHNGKALELTWEDGHHHAFHYVTLREYASDDHTTHPITKEQILPLSHISETLRIEKYTAHDNAITLFWNDSRHHQYHLGWLRAYSEKNFFDPPKITPWPDTFTLQSFDWHNVTTNIKEKLRWLETLHQDGVALLHNTPISEDTILNTAALIGVVRQSNFGNVFDVRVKNNHADSNAYTARALPLHTDLTTREYQPGIQLLHCMENTAKGGLSTLADAFAIAEKFKEKYPQHHDTLSKKEITFANRAKNTDYRYKTPVIVTNKNGTIREARYNPWLRVPITESFEETERIYTALKTYFSFTENENHIQSLKLKQGDLIAFDNRRILHGRTAYQTNPKNKSPNRWLRGCYLEREELESAIRITKRTIRQHKINTPSTTRDNM